MNMNPKPKGKSQMKAGSGGPFNPKPKHEVSKSRYSEGVRRGGTTSGN